jgi:hypothetical protein
MFDIDEEEKKGGEALLGIEEEVEETNISKEERFYMYQYFKSNEQEIRQILLDDAGVSQKDANLIFD